MAMSSLGEKVFVIVIYENTISAEISYLYTFGCYCWADLYIPLHLRLLLLSRLVFTFTPSAVVAEQACICQFLPRIVCNSSPSATSLAGAALNKSCLLANINTGTPINFSSSNNSLSSCTQDFYSKLFLMINCKISKSHNFIGFYTNTKISVRKHFCRISATKNVTHHASFIEPFPVSAIYYVYLKHRKSSKKVIGSKIYIGKKYIYRKIHTTRKIDIRNT